MGVWIFRKSMVGFEGLWAQFLPYRKCLPRWPMEGFLCLLLRLDVNNLLALLVAILVADVLCHLLRLDVKVESRDLFGYNDTTELLEVEIKVKKTQ